MAAQLGPRSVPARVRQRGQVMILTAILIALALLALVISTATSVANSLANQQARNVEFEFARVKDALIGWSASRTPPVGGVNARPGDLPCPDMNNDGFEDGSCATGAIGRVPWKTLGIPEPKDSSGETLWYAIAGPFRNWNMSPAPITSDTVGNLTVYANSTAATLTSQAIAVIFAPGAALGAQDRDSSSTAVCATTGTTTARNLCAANYLEASSGVNNATTGGPFIQAQPGAGFNDRLLVITNEDLMPLVEQRVAREMIAYLNAYKAATATSVLFITLSPGVYPWADLADGNSNGSAGTAYNHNRFPCGTALPVDWGASMIPLLGTGTTPTLPNWLTNGCAGLTGWASVIYYAVARNRLEDNILIPCTTCSAAMLTVNNASGRTGTVCSTSSPPVCTTGIVSAGTADMLLITPGGFTGSPIRNWPASWSDITGYFEDGENYDNNFPNNDAYTVPTSAANNRDRIFIVR